MRINPEAITPDQKTKAATELREKLASGTTEQMCKAINAIRSQHISVMDLFCEDFSLFSTLGARIARKSNPADIKNLFESLARTIGKPVFFKMENYAGKTLGSETALFMVRYKTPEEQRTNIGKYFEAYGVNLGEKIAHQLVLDSQAQGKA